jgi:glycyl-tRNA synthetase alpha subunit
VRYEIRVKGVLGSGWSAWFDGLEVTSDEHGQTTIAGPIADQAALHGLLAKIRDLGLELLEVRRTYPA